jgi:CheY-like chemotaxis protein/anti-sigma regulatory factor (Ser/Thr protein kinase)
VDELRPQAAAGGLGLDFVPTRVVVRTDPLLLERILRNLVVNAIRYTDQGRILVGCRRRSDGIALQVWDTGRGISSAHLGEIFEEFRQLENPARERGKGLGLGLAIVRRLCELLGHRVGVRSRVGHGSMFEVVAGHGVGAGATRGESAAAAAAGGRRLVVLVEDDPMVLAGLEAGLRAIGFRTLSAASVAGLDAILQGIAPEDVRCVVTDYRLPGTSTGLDALARIREVLGRDVPAIILTGDTSPARLREAQASGCRLLSKPADLADLKSAIEATPP